MDASALLQEVDTLFSDWSVSGEVRIKRFLEIEDAANVHFACVTKKCKESKNRLKPCHFAQLQFPTCQANRANISKPARYMYSKSTI